METARTKKRSIIVSVYVFIFLSIILAIWFYLRPSETCTDGIQNQNEKGVDCGGLCTPCEKTIGDDLEIVEKAVVFGGGNNDWDVLFVLKNPNTEMGSPKFSYRIDLLDSSGTVVAQKEGSSYILPSEKRSIVELGFQVPSQIIPTEAKMSIFDVNWKTLKNTNKPQIAVFSKNLSVQSGNSGVIAYAILRNDSMYDLGKVDVSIILRDSQNKIIALNKTEKDIVRSGEERDFRLSWPYELSGEVVKMEVDATSDMYNSMNIIDAPYRKSEY